MNAQREPEIGDAVDDPLVQVDQSAGGASPGSVPASFLTNSCSAATAALPGSWMSQLIRPTRLSTFGTKPNDSRISGPLIGALGEVGEEVDDRVGVQQLRHPVGGALLALEVEPAVLALARWESG